MTEARRRMALLVATGRYDDPGLAGLRAPAGDVDALSAVLEDASIGQFDVQKLVDRPTEEIKTAIDGFFGEARPDDLLLLYFSCHGVLSQGRRFYFATASTVLRYLRATAIDDAFVNGVMHESRARSIVLILDCCHSGAFGKGMAPKSALTVDIEHRFEGRGRVTLSASTELQYAFEASDPGTGINDLRPEAPGSLFTRCLVDGLRSGDADMDEDGEVSVDELYDYVCQRVGEHSRHQTPGLAGDVHGDIVIARSPRRPRLPAVLVQAIESPLAGLRMGAVSELDRLLRSGSPARAEIAREALERLVDDDSRSVAAAASAALERSPHAEPEPPVTDPPKAVVHPQPPAPPPIVAPAKRPPKARRPRPAVLAGALVAVAAAVGAAILLQGGSEPLPYDFDGDGRQEIVLGADTGSPANSGVASGVVLVHEGPGSDARPQLVESVEAGVPGTPTDSDRFGAAIAGADFNGDGHADLAVSVSRKGLIAVLYGSSDGLPGRTGTIERKDLETPPPSSVGTFGNALLAERMNGDRFADLVVGTPAALQEREDGIAGDVHVLFGDEDGLAASRAEKLEPPGDAELGFGARLAAGDVDADGDADLVEGAPTRRPTIGHATYCRGSSRGPTSCQTLPGAASETWSLAVSRVDDDEYADIVQGDKDGSDGSGAVRVWWGSPDGPPIRSTSVDNVESTSGDGFGADVEAADLDGDDEAEVVVGAPGRSGVHVFDVSRAGSVKWSGTAPTLDAPGNGWGSRLSILDYDGDERLDLAVGRETAANLDQAVLVLKGQDAGLSRDGAPLDGLSELAEVDDRSTLYLGR